MASATLRRAAGIVVALLWVAASPPPADARTPRAATTPPLEQALTLWDEGEVHQAVEVLEAARERTTLGAPGLTALGTLYRDTGRRRLAETVFREATRRDRKHAAAWANLASLLEVQARYKEALEAADRAVKLRPQDAGFRSDRAVIHYRLEDLDHAVHDATEAHTRAPEDHWNTLNLALMHLARGKKGDAHTAVRLLTPPREADPDNDKLALAHAQALLAAMKTDQAIEAYEALLRRNPRQVWACWGRGLAAYRKRDFTKARELGDRARKGLPTTFKARDAGAKALFAPDAMAYLGWLEAPDNTKKPQATPALYVQVKTVSSGCERPPIKEALVGAIANSRACQVTERRSYAFSFQVRGGRPGRIQWTNGGEGDADEAAACLSRAIANARFQVKGTCQVEARIARKDRKETPPPSPKAP